ncbi:MAG: hypothetical protein U1F11_04990 [Steroidobacteraceae bacterium]
MRGLFDTRLDRRPPEPLVRMIDALRADPGFDVRLVPTAVYWGRAPQKEGSWLRLLLSENYVLAGRLRKLLQVVFNGRSTMVEIGVPISLRSLLAGDLAAPQQAARMRATCAASSVASAPRASGRPSRTGARS